MKAYIQKVTPAGDASFVYRVKADPRFARGMHCHPEYELTHIIESRGRRFVGDSIESYQAGDCVLLGPNLPHTWRSEDIHTARAGAGRRPLHRAIVVQFRADFLGEKLLGVPEMLGISSVLKRSEYGLRLTGPTRDEVSRRLLGMKRLESLDRLLELLRILQAISIGRGDVRPMATKAALSPPDASQLRRIDRVLALLEERYADSVAQTDAARLTGMSPAGFSRFFRRATGRTFVGYLAEIRVSRASNLLIETDHSIIDIALRSGFMNLSNFNRRFLALRGMTPQEYRARQAEAAVE